VAALEASVTLADTTAVELDAVRSELQAATEARDAAALREEQLGLELLADTATVADERVMAVALGTDMPLVVLDAYVRASRRMAFERPECRVPWSLLAGIGRTESRHGTFGGARVAATGEISEPILGIPLDGTRSALIADTDGGTLDGDLAFDRAVGPMQFIPSTWTRVARDATADGVADPHNLYDAALTAADYLCRAADGLDQEPGARRALLSYNRSVEYGTTVLDRARGYAEAVPIA
jgi:membrane-bound lytic murein transglycosylase B